VSGPGGVDGPDMRALTETLGCATREVGACMADLLRPRSPEASTPAAFRSLDPVPSGRHAPTNLADELQRIYASDALMCDYVPVVGDIDGGRVVTEVPHERLHAADIMAAIRAAQKVAPPVTLRVTTSRSLPVGEVMVLDLAGAVIVGVEPLGRMQRLLAEARNEARAIVRRNLAAEIEWLGMKVRDEPTTPKEAVAFWTGRDMEGATP
jgi:hypothetical protein